MKKLIVLTLFSAAFILPGYPKARNVKVPDSSPVATKLPRPKGSPITICTCICPVIPIKSPSINPSVLRMNGRDKEIYNNMQPNSASDDGRIK